MYNKWAEVIVPVDCSKGPLDIVLKLLQAQPSHARPLMLSDLIHTRQKMARCGGVESRHIYIYMYVSVTESSHDKGERKWSAQTMAPCIHAHDLYSLRNFISPDDQRPIHICTLKGQCHLKIKRIKFMFRCAVYTSLASLQYSK